MSSEEHFAVDQELFSLSLLLPYSRSGEAHDVQHIHLLKSGDQHDLEFFSCSRGTVLPVLTHAVQVKAYDAEHTFSVNTSTVALLKKHFIEACVFTSPDNSV